MEMISISAVLANMIAIHLRQGGSRLEADMLAERLIEQGNAPQREAARAAEIEAAIAARLAAQ